MITKEVIVLADGQFPEHAVPLRLLNSGKSIICCDGAAIKLVKSGLIPEIVIGDLDSLTEEFKIKFSDRLIHDPDQETNDLTKAVNYCIQQGVQKIYILGATGLREDHTLGNISLLVSYSSKILVEMYTDTGFFIPVLSSQRIKTYPGQQISIFSLTPNVPLTLKNLRFPLNKYQLEAWWQGTLNEAIDDWFDIEFEGGMFIVFALYE